MRKNVLKTVVACAAVCIMSGLVVVGTNGIARADDDEQLEVVADYTFEDGEIGDWRSNGITLEIVEGKNSDAGEYLGEAPSEGDKCLKISDRSKGNDWWEKNGVQFNLKKLAAGKTYIISVDVSHDCNEAPASNPDLAPELRPMKIGAYFKGGDDGNDYSKTQEWGQVSDIVSVETGDWVRITTEFTPKDDVYESSEDYYMYIEMMYPEKVGTNGTSYSIQNKEDYYIDNFSIKEKSKATPTPKPTATPEPTEVPVPEATEVPAATVTEVPATDVTPVPVDPAIIAADDEGLDIGYEEVIKGVTYSVTGKDTVAVMGFDTAASKLVIPNTVVIEEGTYNVTSIADKAFKGEGIKNLTIGANITTIGKQAFMGCKSLKKITIKSTAITKMGSKAFSKINAKASVKVPAKNKKAYKKLLKKAGLPAKAKVK